MEATMTEHPHTDDYTRGVYVFVGLALLTLVEFGVAILFKSVSVLMLIAATKVGLVLYYYMHISKLSTPDETLDHHTYAYKSNTNRLGLWLFLLSDAFVFAALLITRFNLLGLTRPHLNQLLGLAISSVLLISSFFANRGEVAAAAGDSAAAAGPMATSRPGPSWQTLSSTSSRTRRSAPSSVAVSA